MRKNKNKATNVTATVSEAIPAESSTATATLELPAQTEVATSTEIVAVDSKQTEAIPEANATVFEPKYTLAELNDFLESIRTGKALDHRPFRFKMSDLGLTQLDKAKIKNARKFHKDMLRSGDEKAKRLAMVREMTLTSHKESATGVSHALRFKDETLAEKLREEKAQERRHARANMIKMFVTPEEKALLQAQREMNKGFKG